MRLAAITAGVLLATAACPARAQPAPAAAEAQRLLQGAADPADFTDVSVAGLLSLKHRPSGLVCHFGSDPQGNTLHSSPEGVICETAGATEIDTLEAFHRPQASDADVQDAVGRALGAFHDARPVSGLADIPSDRPGAPAHVSQRYVAATRGGQQVFVRVAYSRVGQWFLLQRVIAAPTAARLADADAERSLLAAIGQVMEGQGR